MITLVGSRHRSIARWVPVALAPLAFAYALTAIAVARRHGDLTTYAGRSAGAAAVELAAGTMLIAGGLATWRLLPARPLGALALVAGLAWFAPDWVGWQLGPGVVRTLAVATQAVGVAAVAHLALDAGGARWARPPVAAIWTVAVVIALGRPLVYDPLADPSCFTYCAGNPLLAADHRGVARALDWFAAGQALIAVAAVLVATVVVWRRTSVARRHLLPILLPALVLQCLWLLRASALAVSPGDDPHRPPLVAAFACGAIAVAALAAGLVWASSRGRRGARALRRPAQATDSLEAALARATRDASLRVAFPLSSDDGWVDGDGEPIALATRASDRAMSLITREDQPIAAVLHDPASLDAVTLQQEIGPAARLAIDNERLRAEARARLRELKTSRTRIVEAGDAERRRLERDLHDGAQQRLVGLCVVLAMAREQGSPPALVAADADLHRAIDDLRELAHGIHPAELSDEGLAAALETLADRAPVAVDLRALPEERAPGIVETAGYMLVDEVVRLAGDRGDGSPLSVAARRSGDVLTVEVRDEGAPSVDELLAALVGVSDRISALDGRLTAQASDDGGVVLRAELPCV
jgi:signal transduction histidine kinase